MCVWTTSTLACPAISRYCESPRAGAVVGAYSVMAGMGAWAALHTLVLIFIKAKKEIIILSLSLNHMHHNKRTHYMYNMLIRIYTLFSLNKSASKCCHCAGFLLKERIMIFGVKCTGTVGSNWVQYEAVRTLVATLSCK